MAANPSDKPRHFFTLDEYFALEHAGDARYEYWDGDIVCMSGGSRAHGRIVGNVFYWLSARLIGGPCQVFTGDTAIRTATAPPYRYPDVSVACGELSFETIRGVDALVNPALIVEVLSPTTEQLDRGAKFAAYQAIETFREYLLVAPHTPAVQRYTRPSDGLWTPEDTSGMKSEVVLQSIGCSLALSEIYANVKFDAVQK
jgi:Uma2 family endonuclease